MLAWQIDNTIDLSKVRRRAWETRRLKYGPAGHSGIGHAYVRRMPPSPANIEAARDEISCVRRAVQVYGLPESWAHRAIDRIDAADHLLGGPPPIVLRDVIDIPPLSTDYLGG